MLPIKDPDTFRMLADAVEASENFVLTCHVKPDGDAIGSMLAMGLALNETGRDTLLFTHDQVPEVLSFLPGTERVVHELPDPLPENTTLMVLDCGEPHRIGPEHKRLVEQARKILVIDHHLNSGGFAEHHPRCISYIDHEIFAAGALVFRLLEELGWPVSKEVAINLYTAILTDTGCFRHSNTTMAAFEIAGALVELGAEPYAVAQKLYQSYPSRRMELLSLVLRTLEVRFHGRVALLQATPEMFRISRAKEEDTEDFVSYARCIDTVELAAFIRERHAGQVSVSLRSKNWANVADLARQFGGGGHFHAAGFRTSGSAPEVRDALLQRIEGLFEG